MLLGNLKLYNILVMRFLVIFFGIPIFLCFPSLTNAQNTAKVFTNELQELKAYFKVPGLSALVVQNDTLVYENYLGYANLEKQIKLDSSVTFPIASITKLYSATLLMKLVELGTLSLEDKANAYLESSKLSDAIKVKHLLSHTSQGNIGGQFFYSNRFGLLTQIMENASGITFKDLITREIIKPLGLQNTFLLEDSSQLVAKKSLLATPYTLEGTIKKGFIDYGYSSSAGIVTTARELQLFNNALDNNRLIGKASKEVLFKGLGKGLPYAYGIFHQKIEGFEVLWVYGQYDCYSSLLLKVPSKNTSLVLLGNNSLLSDPARLIMGDVTSSLFALSFLKNYVLGKSDMPLLETPDKAYTTSFSKETFYKKKVMAQALAASFMARFNTKNHEISSKLIQKTLTQYPNVKEYGTITLLHNLSFLKTVAFHKELGAFNTFDHELEQLGNTLLKKTPNDPYVLYYMGNFYDGKGLTQKAKLCFETIVNLENFSPHWYTNDAKNWLQEHP